MIRKLYQWLFDKKEKAPDYEKIHFEAEKAMLAAEERRHRERMRAFLDEPMRPIEPRERLIITSPSLHIALEKENAARAAARARQAEDEAKRRRQREEDERNRRDDLERERDLRDFFTTAVVSDPTDTSGFGGFGGGGDFGGGGSSDGW